MNVLVFCIRLLNKGSLAKEGIKMDFKKGIDVTLIFLFIYNARIKPYVPRAVHTG